MNGGDGEAQPATQDVGGGEERNNAQVAKALAYVDRNQISRTLAGFTDD